METKAQKWGNSLAIRIPKRIAQQVGMSVNDRLHIEIVADGVIVLEPRRRQKYQLSDLLKGITKKNMHDEIDFGCLLGREVW